MMFDTIYAHEVADIAALKSGTGMLPERADVAIVGGGLTGLSAALHLARAGRSVALVEAGALGDGASGRNGGQLHPGQRRDQLWLEAHVGREAADALWMLGEEALALIHTLREEFGDMGWREGLIEAAHDDASFDAVRRYQDHLAARYGIADEILSRDALAQAIGSRRYVGGMRTKRGGHLNPLALVAALARGCTEAGVALCTGTRALGLTRGGRSWRVATTDGEVVAADVLVAGNGYLKGLEPRVERRLLPLVNHIVATESLAPIIAGGEAVADTRQVVRYFRQDAAGRMIFGGGESFGRGPRDVARFVQRYLAEVYPQLAGAPIAAAWSGTLGITPKRTPFIRRLEPGLYAAAGYSGQGLGIATFAGKVIAETIAGDTGRLDTFSRLPVPTFPGGTRFRVPLANLAMTWFSLRDRLGLPQAKPSRRG